MMISENAGKDTIEGIFLCAVCRKGVGINSTLCQFCSCWVHSGIRGKLKEDSKFTCQACANQQADIAENCHRMEGICQPLEIVEKFYCLGDTIRARRGTSDIVITRIKSGWCKFRDLKPLLASRNFLLGAKCKLSSACVSSAMLY